MGSLDKALLTGFICRICSKMNKLVIHVHGEEGERINLANQLQNYLGVDIYLNDNLPKTVCPSCVIKLRMYYEWMELIMKTQKEFGNTNNDPKMMPEDGLILVQNVATNCVMINLNKTGGRTHLFSLGVANYYLY